MSKLRNIHISGINAVWDSDTPESIHTVAEKAMSMIIEFSKIDPIFQIFSYVPKSKPQTKFNLKETSKDKCIQILAECILDDKRGDIRHHEKDYKPDVNYSRDFGFSLLFNFKIGKKNVFSYTPRLGVKGRNSHSITYFQSGFEFEYKWFQDIFQTMIYNSSPSPIYGKIGLSNMDFSKAILKELKLNWTVQIGNYFSDELNWLLDKIDTKKHQIEGLSGSFIYCADPDFMLNKESYDIEVEKLLSLNKGIAIEGNIK